MLDRIRTLRLSRRSALQLITASAAAALVPLGSIAAAQSSSPTGADPQPTSATTNRSGSGERNRFAPPPAPSPSPAPVSPSPAPALTPTGTSPAAGNSSAAATSSDAAGAEDAAADAAEDAADTEQAAPAGDAKPGTRTDPAAQGNKPAASAGGGAWVQNFRATDLWSGPDNKAITFGQAPAYSYFKVLAPQDGPRIKVQNPLTNGVAYVTAADVGPSGDPPDWYFNQKSEPSILARIVGGANIRSAPVIQDDTIVGHAGHNEAVTVIGELKDANGETWYRIGPNQMVHSSLVRLPSKFPAHPGQMIVAELTDPCIVTAYEDGKMVYSTLSLKGTLAWQTPTGFFTILRRVENEIMSSEGLGIPRDAPGGYYLKDVLYTQYFTDDGASIHYNWWSSNWGYSGSHGCLGMSYDDALWFWQWAGVGTPLAIQE
jgi:hypothetical protein